MIDKIISYAAGAVSVILTLYTIVTNAIHFCAKWKCRKKHYNEYSHRCHESSCRWAPNCENYQYISADEEIRELYDMIESCQERIEKTKAR